MLAPERAWPFSTGTGVTVAVIDSGVDASVPQLRGRVLAGDSLDTSSDAGAATADCLGHGTMVAGIIGAQKAAGTGFEGIAPGALILPVRIYSQNTTASSTALAAALIWAADHGAKVVNISASADQPSDTLRAAVAYAQAHDVLIVAAAGNGFQQGDPVTYPASYPGVLAVGSIGADGHVAATSQSGPFVSLVAPGENVLSLGTGGPGHVLDSGTSFAAPFVSGVAALVRSAYPGLSAAQVKNRLEQTADHPALPLPDAAYGWGVVDPYRALTELLPSEDRTPAAAGAQTIPRPTTGDHSGHGNADLALAVFGGAALAVLLVFVATRAAASGRARRRTPTSTPTSTS